MRLGRNSSQILASQNNARETSFLGKAADCPLSLGSELGKDREFLWGFHLEGSRDNQPGE